jgi:hypothetical protein
VEDQRRRRLWPKGARVRVRNRFTGSWTVDEEDETRPPDLH